MLKIMYKDVEYLAEIKVSKYGAILEIKENNRIWYQNIFDLSMVNGTLSNHLTKTIEDQVQALRDMHLEDIKAGRIK